MQAAEASRRVGSVSVNPPEGSGWAGPGTAALRVQRSGRLRQEDRKVKPSPGKGDLKRLCLIIYKIKRAAARRPWDQSPAPLKEETENRVCPVPAAVGGRHVLLHPLCSPASLLCASLRMLGNLGRIG